VSTAVEAIVGLLLLSDFFIY